VPIKVLRKALTMNNLNQQNLRFLVHFMLTLGFIYLNLHEFNDKSIEMENNLPPSWICIT